MKLFDVYPLFDIDIVSGRGCRVTDSEGQEYLDLYGGHAVVSVGHSHPTVVKAIKQQAEKLIFYSNSVINDLQAQLAEPETRLVPHRTQARRGLQESFPRAHFGRGGSDRQS